MYAHICKDITAYMLRNGNSEMTQMREPPVKGGKPCSTISVPA